METGVGQGGGVADVVQPGGRDQQTTVRPQGPGDPFRLGGDGLHVRPASFTQSGNVQEVRSDRARPPGQPRLHIGRSVADEHRGPGQRVEPVADGGTVPGDGHQERPFVQDPVTADGEVDPRVEPEGAQLDVGVGLDVPGERRLDHVGVGRQPPKALGRPRQGVPPGPQLCLVAASGLGECLPDLP
jgi:hypothetical protein